MEESLIPEKDEKGIGAYAEIMREIGLRIIRARSFLASGAGDQQLDFSVESAALDIRMICESMLISSFILHSAKVNTLMSSLRKNDKWDKVRKILERENSEYMPVAFLSKRREDGIIEMIDIENPILTGSDLFKIWGKVSELLHHRNPLLPRTNTQDRILEFSSYLSRFSLILHQHRIHIPSDGSLYMINVELSDDLPKVYWWIAQNTNEAGRFLVEKIGNQEASRLMSKNPSG